MMAAERSGAFLLVLLGSVLFMLVLYQFAVPGLVQPRGHLSNPYLDPNGDLSLNPDLDLDPDLLPPFPGAEPHYRKKFYFPVRVLERRADFCIEGDDVMVFLHIQKTGGTTFGRHLVQNVRLQLPCDCRPGQKKCTCYRPNRKETWLFSRFSTGWSCGLHADWTELTSCVPGVLDKRESKGNKQRKFYYITLLRDPVSRYLSEWRHVQRGATWKTSLHMCDGRTPTPEELPSCYEGSDWSGCTLQQFMECPYNLANNRQVRMLADLSLVGCYNMSFIPEKKRAQILLESAKKNLRDMAFFGLTEFQRKTQYLFERTFHLKFIRPFVQYNSTRAAGVDLDNGTVQRIEELNDLDVQLYDYARDLFQQRFMYARQQERREQRMKDQSGLLTFFRSPIVNPPPPPRDEAPEAEGSRLPTEDYMNHIINRW